MAALTASCSTSRSACQFERACTLPYQIREAPAARAAPRARAGRALPRPPTLKAVDVAAVVVAAGAEFVVFVAAVGGVLAVNVVSNRRNDVDGLVLVVAAAAANGEPNIKINLNLVAAQWLIATGFPQRRAPRSPRHRSDCHTLSAS